MNEPAGEQITELLNDDHLHLTDADEETPARPDREGLPPTFRMRHDAHYVDDLMSRAAHDSPATPPDRRDSRTGAEPASPAPIGPALGVIAERLESLITHAGAARPQLTAPSLVAQSVQVEFVRVTRLARAAATLQQHEPPMRVELSGREIVEATSRAAAPVAFAHYQ